MVKSEVLDNIKDTFDSLEKTTSWSLAMLFATLASAIYTSDAITIFGIEIPKHIGGIATFGILCCINFKVFHLLKNVKMSLQILQPDTDIAFMRIRLHPWILNPFSETDGDFSLFSDNFGYSLLLLFWWLGAQTGFYLIRSDISEMRLVITGLILFSIYLFLGLMSMFLISELMYMICRNKSSLRTKVILTFLAIPFGAFGLKALFP